jgi:hypothetical protein
MDGMRSCLYLTSLLLLAAALSLIAGCAAPATPTAVPTVTAPLPVTAVVTGTAPPLLANDAAATAVTPSPTPIPTSTLVDGWLLYRNDFYGYEFSYPPEGRLEVSGATGFPSEELPAGLTADAYLRQIEASYPDGICAAVRLEMGTVVFMVAPERGGRYGGPCGWTGVGDYDLIEQTEPITIAGQEYVAAGFEVRERGDTAVWIGEFFSFQIEDGTRIQFGSAADATPETYQAAKPVLLQIVASYRSLAPQGALLQTPAPSPMLTATPRPCPDLAELPPLPPRPLRLFYIEQGNVYHWDEASDTTTPLLDSGDVSQLWLSGDGNRLAFLRQQSYQPVTFWWPSSPFSLWVMARDGRDPRQLLNEADLLALVGEDETALVLPSNLTWTPSSDSLVFNPYRIHAGDDLGSNFYLDELWVVDAVTGEMSWLPGGEGGDFTVSPDGLYLTISDATTVRLLSADGRVRYDNVLTYPYISLGHYVYTARPVWSPDSAYFMAALPSENPFADEATLTIWRVLVADGAAEELATLRGFPLPISLNAGSAIFSPDLSQIAYYRSTAALSNNRDLFIADVSGAWEVRYDRAFHLYFLGWSPDNRHFNYAVAGRREGEWLLRNGRLCEAPQPFDGPRIAVNTAVTWIDGRHFLYLSDARSQTHPDLILGHIDGSHRVIAPVSGLHPYQVDR